MIRSKSLSAAVLLAWSISTSYALASSLDSRTSRLPRCNTSTTTLTPQLFPDLASRRIKATYGPFTAPSRSKDDGMADFNCLPPLPCTDCAILYMHAGLEYADGSNADIETGMMLHHVVFAHIARKDPMCGDERQERFFASGNERTVIDLTGGGTNEVGYMFSPKDEVVLSLEVMNMQDAAKEVMLTVVWEALPSPPASFRSVQPYWFDIGGCGGSGKPSKQDSVFTYSSPTVKARASGTVAVAAAHLHDGGTHLKVLRNGMSFCDSYATYEGQHITEMETCTDREYDKGDEFWVVAYYDTSKHAPMAHTDGELEPVMGIALIYAVESQGHDRVGRGGRWLSVSFVVLVLVLGLGLGFWWYQRRTGLSQDVLPVWLRRQLQNKRGAPDYEPLLR